MYELQSSYNPITSMGPGLLHYKIKRGFINERSWEIPPSSRFRYLSEGDGEWGQRHFASVDEMNLSVYCLWLSLSSEDAVPSSLPPIPPPQSISLEYTKWEQKPQLIHDSHLG